ncbi:hypothetical protein CYY_009578 [Polysphondylium violaceum]|uniref:Acetyl-coenzyme A transporter 1 n=1 Tax=Polysphondylium violaceum TaxID=133409 RepID=A0A8J4UPE2_9MYCE|nr:hypothetical protein CYY_009578 [Polysphondylium violaceum]
MFYNYLKKTFGHDLHNILWLIALYLIQGIPIGLSFGTIPFLLHKHATYTQIGIFYFSTYPYSLKLLWSPLVDSYYWKSFGRRKSWIVPIQIIAGLFFIAISFKIEYLVEHVQSFILPVTAFFFILIFLMATQDIAVDAWALTILSKSNLHYASICQTIGLNTGYFLSYTIFLALNSPSFANRYFRSTPSEEGMITLSGYVFFWGCVFVMFSIYLALFKGEENNHIIMKEKVDRVEENVYNYSSSSSPITTPPNELNHEIDLEPIQVYKQLWKIIKMPHIKTLALMFLMSKVVFQANESVLNLKLLEKGLKREDIAFFSIIQFPCVILFSILSSNWFKHKPLTTWTYSYIVAVLFVFLNMLGVVNFPQNQEIGYYFLVLLVCSLCFAFTYTLMSSSQSSFFLKISDKSIGGTYVTLLNTIANFAGTYPKFFIFILIDFWTTSKCIVNNNNSNSSNSTTNFSSPITFDNISKELCHEKGGEYIILQDGYYIVSVLSILYGVFMFFVLKKYLIPIERIKL